ncbi:hypothetical protein B1A_14666, partial [mine drainage metagenome]
VSTHRCGNGHAAGLPKAPSRYNPIINPQRAALRQQYVLRRMHDLKYLNDADVYLGIA